VAADSPGSSVVDRLGMELLLDVPVDPHLLDTSHVAGPRAVPQPIEDVTRTIGAGKGFGVGREARGRPLQQDDGKESARHIRG
jgi:hypothetical protein